MTEISISKLSDISSLGFDHVLSSFKREEEFLALLLKLVCVLRKTMLKYLNFKVKFN